jgi:hypothetical protein
MTTKSSKGVRIADGAAFDAYERRDEELCLAGTRVDVLGKITAWAAANDGCHVYWLSGLAGTGKSTIARTVARHFARRQQLGASFFFKRGGGDLASARLFVTTIAVQLAERVPLLKKHVAAAVRATRNVSARTLQDQ